MLGENNLPPESITETWVTSRLASHDRVKLEAAFERWDRSLQFGVTFKLLADVLADLGLLNDTSREAFVRRSGYFKEVSINHQANQLACSVSLQAFLDVVAEQARAYKAIHLESTDTTFVDLFLEMGEKKLVATRSWEPTHQELRREAGRESSQTSADKTAEIVRRMNADPSLTVDDLDAELRSHGMSLSLAEKIGLLADRRNRLLLEADRLTSRLAEYREYGHGDDPAVSLQKVAESLAAIESDIESLKNEYRRVFPRREVFGTN